MAPQRIGLHIPYINGTQLPSAAFLIASKLFIDIAVCNSVWQMSSTSAMGAVPVCGCICCMIITMPIGHCHRALFSCACLHAPKLLNNTCLVTCIMLCIEGKIT